MNRPVNPNSSRETVTKASASFSSHLLATKFFVPVTSGTLIARPRLIALLNKGLKYPFTLVSAPAGFGKTTLLSTWAQSLQACDSQTLPGSPWTEEDNETPPLLGPMSSTRIEYAIPRTLSPTLLTYTCNHSPQHTPSSPC